MKIRCVVFGCKWQWRWWDMSKNESYVCLRCGRVESLRGDNK